MKIRVKDHVKFQPDKLVKIALAATGRVQLDLYCVAPGQAQKAHTHDAQDGRDYVRGLGTGGGTSAGGSEKR